MSLTCSCFDLLPSIFVGSFYTVSSRLLIAKHVSLYFDFTTFIALSSSRSWSNSKRSLHDHSAILLSVEMLAKKLYYFVNFVLGISECKLSLINCHTWIICSSYDLNLLHNSEI